CSFAYKQVMLPTHVVKDVFVERVSRYANRLVAHNSRKSYYRNLRSTSPNIYYHRAYRSVDIDSNSQRCRYGLMNHVYLFGPGMLSGIPYGTLFHFGDTGGDADYHAMRLGKQSPVGVDHLDHAPDHLLGSMEVGDHAVFQW